MLYAGLMMTKQGPKVLEYNVRFGDPECQPLLMRLKTDLVEILDATVEGRLDKIGPLEWDPRPALCVVMASQGYPGAYQKGQRIRGLAGRRLAARRQGFSRRHGPPRRRGGDRRRAGAERHRPGESIAKAKLNAYRAVKCIRWPGAWCRKDIGDKALLG